MSSYAQTGPKVKTAMSAAYDFFQIAESNNEDVVSNIALHKYAAEMTGQTRDVLHGTLDGVGPGSLISADWYMRIWERYNDGGRLYHRWRTKVGDPVLHQELEFDHPDKLLTYRTIMGLFLPAEGSPEMLTLAGVTGICVRSARARNPNVRITNIEKREEKYLAWQKRQVQLGIETEDHLTKFQEFVKTWDYRRRHWALVNVDTVGYAAPTMESYLTSIVAAKNADIVIVTTQHMDGFRGNGVSQELLRKKYAGIENPHVTCITDWMEPAYEMADFYGYINGCNTDVLVYSLSNP